MASIASRFSVRLTGKPAARSSTMKPESNSSIGDGVASVEVMVVRFYRSARARNAGLLCATIALKLLGRLRNITLILQKDVEGLDGFSFGD